MHFFESSKVSFHIWSDIFSQVPNSNGNEIETLQRARGSFLITAINSLIKYIQTCLSE